MTATVSKKTLRARISVLRNRLLKRPDDQPEPLSENEQATYADLLPTAEKVARKLQKRWEWIRIEDVLQQASLVLVDAIRQHKPEKSPSLKAWVAWFTRRRIIDWLRGEHTTRRFPRKLQERITRRKRHRAETARYFDRGSNPGFDRPSRRIEIAELVEAARRKFGSRDTNIFVDRGMGFTADEIAYKWGMTPRRVNQILADVGCFIRDWIRGGDLKLADVIDAIRTTEQKTKKDMLRSIGWGEEELEKSENPFPF